MRWSGLVELEAVVAVARHRNFRAAAIELGVSRSALSHAIARYLNRVMVTRIVAAGASCVYVAASVVNPHRDKAEEDNLDDDANPYHSTFSFSRQSDPFDYDIDRRPQTVRTSHRHTVFVPARVGRATHITSVLSAGSTLKAAGVLFERQTTSSPPITRNLLRGKLCEIRRDTTLLQGSGGWFPRLDGLGGSSPSLSPGLCHAVQSQSGPSSPHREATAQGDQLG
jgi:hypothetical protein